MWGGNDWGEIKRPWIFGAAGLLAVWVAAALPVSSYAVGELPDPAPWALSGSGSGPLGQAVETAGNEVFVGGDLWGAGPRTGAGVPVSASTGAPETPFAEVAGGPIDVVVSDRNNGWYIGGRFKYVGGVARPYLAHINPDGLLDPTFDPGPDGSVSGIEVSSDRQAIYVAGLFTQVGGATRTHLAALEPTGDATSWQPEVNLTPEDIELSHSGGSLYVAFRNSPGVTVDGITHQQLLELQTSDGSVTAWNPAPSDRVRRITISPDDQTLYLAGQFQHVNGVPRTFVAAVRTSDGAVTPFDFGQTPTNGYWVNDFEFSHDGQRLFIGGQPASVDPSPIAGANRSCVFEVDPASGQATSWDPHLPFLCSVTDLGISPDDTTVYVGGAFALSASDASVKPWDPRPGASDDSTEPSVRSVVPSTDGTRVFLGGGFASLGTQRRDGLLVTDPAGNGGPWEPVSSEHRLNADNVVTALAASHDGRVVYVARDYSTYTGSTMVDHHDVSAVDRQTRQVLWTTVADGRVNGLAAAPDGQAIYLEGDFTTVGGNAHYHLASLDAASGSLRSWNPAPDGSNSAADCRYWATSALAVSPDSQVLYVGLNCALTPTFGGAIRNGIVALNTNDASATSWAPSVDGPVRAIDISPDGDSVYIGGNFASVNGQPRANVAEIALADGSPTGWNPGTDGQVSSLSASPNGELVYLMGGFYLAGGQARGNLAAIRTLDGKASVWAPQVDLGGLGSLPRGEIEAAPDGHVFLTGGFTSIGPTSARGFASFTNPSAALPAPPSGAPGPTTPGPSDAGTQADSPRANVTTGQRHKKVCRKKNIRHKKRCSRVRNRG